MPVQRAPAVMRSLVDQEVVLPTVMTAPAPPPKAPDTEGLPKRRVAVPTPLPLPLPQRSVNSPLGSSHGAPQRQFVSPPVMPAPLTNQWFTEPVPAVLPLPRKQQKQSRVVPVSPKQGAVPPGKTAVITVTPDITRAPAGFISALITISDTDKGTRVQSQQVAITILNQAVINVSSTTMTFTTTNPTQSLVITNTGSALLNWTLLVQPLSPWLSVDITVGKLSPGESQTVKVTCDSTDLSVGNHTVTLVVSDTDTGTPVVPQDVQVIVKVS